MGTITELFPLSAFNELAEKEAGHWWFRSRNRILLWVLKKYVGSFENFLEVGCGTGFVLSAIHNSYPTAELHGSEYFEEGLTHARRRVPSANFSKLDARKMKAYHAEVAECTTPDFSFQNQQTFIIVSCGLVGPEGLEPPTKAL